MRAYYGCNRPTGCNARGSEYCINVYTHTHHHRLVTFSKPHLLCFPFISTKMSLYLPNLPPITHIKWCTVTKAKAKVKQFSKRWWKRKPLKMLFVYGWKAEVFPPLVYIFMLFTSALYGKYYTQGCGK